MDMYFPIFQPTRPLRGATAGLGVYTFRKRDFNPRAPCGARLRSGHKVFRAYR